MNAIKSDSDSDSDEQKRWSVFEKKKPGVTPQNWRLKKGRQVFQEKNRVVTPSVAAPGVTHPSDATARPWHTTAEPPLKTRLHIFIGPDSTKKKKFEKIQTMIMLRIGTLSAGRIKYQTFTNVAALQLAKSRKYINIDQLLGVRSVPQRQIRPLLGRNVRQ